MADCSKVNVENQKTVQTIHEKLKKEISEIAKAKAWSAEKTKAFEESLNEVLKGMLTLVTVAQKVSFLNRKLSFNCRNLCMSCVHCNSKRIFKLHNPMAIFPASENLVFVRNFML